MGTLLELPPVLLSRHATDKTRQNESYILFNLDSAVKSDTKIPHFIRSHKMTVSSQDLPFTLLGSETQRWLAGL